MSKEKNTSSNKPASLLKRLFTLGKNFSYRDLYDRAKKYFVEALGIFIVISFSFYVENKGIEYETTKSYEEMLFAFKKNLTISVTNIEEYKEGVKGFKTLYDDLISRWESNTDSLFMEKEWNLTSSMEVFGDIYKYEINTRGYNVFKMGGVDFELMNYDLSEKITKFYERDISNIIENSSVYEKKIIDDYKNLILNKWIPDIDNVNLDSSQFWINNRKYLQNDSQLKWIIKERIHNYDLILYEMDATINRVKSVLKSIDSIHSKMLDDTYFIYWKLNGD